MHSWEARAAALVWRYCNALKHAECNVWRDWPKAMDMHALLYQVDRLKRGWRFLEQRSKNIFRKRRKCTAEKHELRRWCGDTAMHWSMRSELFEGFGPKKKDMRALFYQVDRLKSGWRFLWQRSKNIFRKGGHAQQRGTSCGVGVEILPCIKACRVQYLKCFGPKQWICMLCCIKFTSNERGEATHCNTISTAAAQQALPVSS